MSLEALTAAAGYQGSYTDIRHVHADCSRLFVRMRIEDRAVSLTFIDEYERSLKALAPADYNSNVLQGHKAGQLPLLTR